jgi:hypothetical protein
MSIISLLITLVIYGLIFWLVWWAIGAIGIPEPFHKVITVILVLVAVLLVIGLLTGGVGAFPLANYRL